MRAHDGTRPLTRRAAGRKGYVRRCILCNPLIAGGGFRRAVVGAGSRFLEMHRNLFVSVRREILDLCDSTMALLEFIRSAGHLLTRAVPCEVWAMHAVDPSTLLPGGGVLNGLSFPRDAAWELAKREFLDRDVNVFSDLARSPTNAGSLQLATGGAPQASLRFRNLLRTIKISDELRATYVANSACWGISTFSVHAVLFRQRRWISSRASRRPSAARSAG